MADIQKMPKGAGKSSFELIDPEILAEALPIKPGSVVLDLACGKGTYSTFLSKIVGDQGLVYAVDMWKQGLLLLEQEIENRNITNIMTILGDATKNFGVDEYHIDLCLMSTVLHDFEEANQTDAVLKQVKPLLKPDGCLAVIEFKKIEGPPGPPIKIRLSENEVNKIVTEYNFRKVKTVEIGNFNYMMTFQSI